MTKRQIKVEMKINEDGCRTFRAVMCIRTRQKRESQKRNIERVVGRKEGKNQNPFRERKKSTNKASTYTKTRNISVFIFLSKIVVLSFFYFLLSKTRRKHVPPKASAAWFLPCLPPFLLLSIRRCCKSTQRLPQVTLHSHEPVRIIIPST